MFGCLSYIVYLVFVFVGLFLSLIPGATPFSFPPANIFRGCHRYTRDLWDMEVCCSHHTVSPGDRGPSPVVLDSLALALRCHPDSAFSSFILQGMAQGFHIGFEQSTCCLRSCSANHPSALANRTVVDVYIANEVTLGRLIGPLAREVAVGMHVSPIGLVPKAHQAGKWRMIVDLSCPHGHSVNDGISPNLASIQYASVDHAVQIILSLGQHTLLVKIDLKDAYRIVPVHPGDHHLLGIAWQGCTYIDRCLPFGLRSAPKLFSAVSDALAWAFMCAGIHGQVHYLDDFLLFGGPHSSEASENLHLALQVCRQLGIPVATHKTEGPSTVLTFLGILVDSSHMELRLPTDKLHRLQSLVSAWARKRTCVRKELESFIGHLSHAATVVRQGRTFLRELFILLHVARSPHHHVRLNAVAKADIQWWTCFLHEWNGRSFFPRSAPSVHVYSDASGSFGCGAFQVGGSWCQLQWPESWQGGSIATLELIPIVIAAALWGPQWHGQMVLFHSDNVAAVCDINRMFSSNSSLIHLLRCLSFFAAYFGFHFKAEHVPGVKNSAADALSRNNVHLFLSLVPQALPRSPIPLQLQELLVGRIPDWGSSDWTILFRSCLPVALPPPPCPPTRLVGSAI